MAILDGSTADLATPEGWGESARPAAAHGAQADSMMAGRAVGVGSFHDRWDWLRELAANEEALPDLMAVLTDAEQDWDARWFAARALGKLGDGRAVPALVATFATTPDEDLRQTVAMALTHLGPAAIARLGEQLADPQLRPTAVQALAHVHHPDVVPLLIEAMADGRSAVRATALDALGPYGDMSALKIIQAGLQDEAGAVRAAAIRGLMAVRRHLPGDRVLGDLLPLLSDTDPAVVQQAILALGRLPQPAATAALIERLRSPDAPTALQALLLQALARHDTVLALDGLIQSWAYLPGPGRLALVQALSGMSLPHRQWITTALKTWLGELPPAPEQRLLRCHLVQCLSHLGDAITLQLILPPLLEDPDPGVRLHAAAALSPLSAESGGWSQHPP